MSLSLIKYLLFAARRDKLVLSFLLVLVVGSCLSIFLGSAAIVEQDYFTLVFTGASLRLASVLSLVLFTAFFIRRSFDSKDIEFLLSRPISRLSIIVSYAVALMVICFVTALCAGLAVYAVSPHLFALGHVVWCVSLMVELIMITCTALFFAMYMSSAAAACMATFGVYVLGRMMGQLLGIVDSHVVDDGSIFSLTLQAVSIFTPRLDLMAQSSWLIYGIEDAGFLLTIIAQLFVFTSLVLSAACWDFVKRQF